MNETLVFGSGSSGSDWQGNLHGHVTTTYGEYVVKRQMFLRSYQFSRKQSLSEKLNGSVRRLKRFVWTRLRSARKLKRVVWSRLTSAFLYRRKRFFRLLLHQNEPSYRFF
ncbi:unnamed protein product [Cochlearia groenlandica]